MEGTATKIKPNIDFPALILMAVLIIIGIILIFSATHPNEHEWMRNLYRTQIIWALIGVVGIYLIILLPFRLFYDFSYLFYAFTLLLLILVLIKGSTIGGATRWFAVGPIKIQPSEIAKVGTILALARYMSSRNISFEKLTSLIVPFLIALVPMALILKQPDLSTSLVFMAMFFPMLFWSGLSLFEIFLILSPMLSLVFAFNIYLWAAFFILLFILLIKLSKNLTLTSVILVINFVFGVILPMIWNRLHDYQQNRILAFVDPKRDPFGAGYQVIQSKVAIGSGKLAGKGFLAGTQTRLSFLPEQHTDFIFSVLGEQFGFFGCVIVLIVFALLISRLFYLASENNNRFLNLIVVGIASQLAFHIVTNIAMTVGIMPVTGLPLPFLSYGGSFLITCMVLMGLAISIRKKSGEL
jgi:rod shape determining protein RodA